jgi:hypothetical protein
MGKTKLNETCIFEVSNISQFFWYIYWYQNYSSLPRTVWSLRVSPLVGTRALLKYVCHIGLANCGTYILPCLSRVFRLRGFEHRLFSSSFSSSFSGVEVSTPCLMHWCTTLDALDEKNPCLTRWAANNPSSNMGFSNLVHQAFSQSGFSRNTRG